MGTTLRLWLLTAALGFSWLPVQTGGVAGKITEATGGVIPGATVTARSEGRTRTAVTKGGHRPVEARLGPDNSTLGALSSVPVIDRQK